MPTRIRELIREVHRRSLWQVLGVYVLGAWFGYEVILSLTEGLGLPAWVPPIALVLFIVGLPIVVATALVQEGPPMGTADSASGQPTTERGDEEDGGPPPADATAVARTVSEPAVADTEGREPSPQGTGALSVLTWNRAIAGAVLAFAALGLAALGFMAMRSLGIGPAATLFTRGDLTAGDTIVLADFEGPGDVAPVVTEALRVDIASSPVVHLLPGDRVSQALRRMRRDDTGSLSRDAARELAVREGHPAVIAGEVNRLAASYVLTAEVVTAQEGGVLASFRETARDSTELVDAIDALSESLRSKIGESIRSVRSTPPLARYTTSSLEALRRYAAGVRLTQEGRGLDAIGAYRDAVRLDSQFAMAWRKIGIEYSNLNVQPTRRDRALRRAYELSDRLPNRERGLAVGTYHLIVTGRADSAISAFRGVAERYDDPIAYNNLATLLNRAGDWRGAETAAHNAMRIGHGITHYVNLTTALYGQGRVDSARSVNRAGLDRYPGHPALLLGWIAIPYGEGRRDRALARIDSALTRYGEDIETRAWMNLQRGHILWTLGRVREALAAHEITTGILQRLGFQRDWLSFRFSQARDLAWTLRNPRRGRNLLETALRAVPLDSLPASDRPYLSLAEAYAVIGDTAAAAGAIRRWEQTPAAAYRPEQAASARGWLALASDRPREAIAHFRTVAERVNCAICGWAALGHAYEQAGVPDSAIVAFERFVETQQLSRIIGDASALGRALESLARLHAAEGQPEESARYLARLIELWKDADPVLQERVEAARAELEEIVDRRG